MKPTVRSLLAQRSLGLSLLSGSPDDETLIRWVHSSDLADPTPFLESGQFLLTTGTQFSADATGIDFDEYVSRLVRRGIVGLGFGTEVVRSGTPIELTTSCAKHGLALLEVPYVTPFIAIIRWAADAIAAEARARDDWSLAAQRSISLAALGENGLPGSLAALADQLDCRVAVLDRNGALDPALTPSTFTQHEIDALTPESVRLLRSGRRSASRLPLGESQANLQTLGQRGRLSGVLAIVGTGVHDAAANAVITSAVALTEVSLEQGRLRRISVLPVHRELLALLLAGRADVVERALPGLVPSPSRVIVSDTVSVPESADTGGWLPEAIEHFAASQQLHPFLAPHGAHLAILTPESEYAQLIEFLREARIVAGASELTELEGLARALEQALFALSRARSRRTGPLEYSALEDAEYVDIVSGDRMTEFASARLSAMLADRQGRELLAFASVWLRHNGSWDPAARELGLHRHVLRSRLRTIEETLGISLDSFADRAQLWSMLSALGFTGRHR